MRHSITARIGILALLLVLCFSLPRASSAQSNIDLVVHYVEGTPATQEVAYDVSVYLSVVDSAGNPVKDLKAEAFTVTEDSQKVEVGSLNLVTDEPINVVLVLDTSGTMSGPGIDAAKTAAANFVARLNPDDKVAVITFDNTVKTQIDYTTDKNAARDRITLIEAVRNAGTCLYDAAYQAIQMGSTLPAGRRAVVLFTDGVDETASGGACSAKTADDVIDLASEGGTRTPVFTIGMGKRIDAKGLQRLAELTGGRYHEAPDSSQLEAAFLRLSDQLRSQYVLTYKSHSGPGAHTLAVNVNYLNAQDNDTRSFLLPPMATRATFTSPAEGQPLSGMVKLAVTLSGQGEPVSRVEFQVNGQAVGSDETVPYELDADFSQYQNTEVTITAVVFGAGDAELSRTSMKANLDVPATAGPEETEAPAPSLALVIGVGVGGLVLLSAAVALFLILRRRSQDKEEKAREEAWARAQSDEGLSSQAGQGAERTIDSWEPSSDALGLLVVEGSDDPAMIGHRFEITQSTTTLGRAADNDINFPKDSPVSRHHAEITEKKGGLYLAQVLAADAEGRSKPPTYGTFVNDSPIEADPILLQTGDEIRLGKRVRLKFQATGRTSSQEERTYDGLITPEDPDKTHDQL